MLLYNVASQFIKSLNIFTYVFTYMWFHTYIFTQLARNKPAELRESLYPSNSWNERVFRNWLSIPGSLCPRCTTRVIKHCHPVFRVSTWETSSFKLALYNSRQWARERKEGSSGRIGGVAPAWRGREKTTENRNVGSESSGTTCANYFAKQFLAVVAGVAKSFDRCDTGSIPVRYNIAAQWPSIQTSRCRVSRIHRTDGSMPTKRRIACPSCFDALPTKRKKKKKREKKQVKNINCWSKGGNGKEIESVL